MSLRDGHGEGPVRNGTMIQKLIHTYFIQLCCSLCDFLRRKREIRHPVGKTLFQCPEDLIPVAAGQIHLGYKNPRRDLLAFQELPDHACIGLDSFTAADYQNRRIRYAQSTSGLGKEICMARCIDKGEFRFIPGKNRLLGKCRNPTASLEIFKV